MVARSIGNQLPLPKMKRRKPVSHVHKGMMGEVLVARALEGSGYQVSISHECGDLTVVLPDGEMLGIEVKLANRCQDGKWRFTLWKQGSQDHRNTDFVILLCALKSGDPVPFVVPTSVLRDQNVAVISSFPLSYAGKFAQFRQNMKQLALTPSPSPDGEGNQSKGAFDA